MTEESAVSDGDGASGAVFQHGVDFTNAGVSAGDAGRPGCQHRSEAGANVANTDKR